MYYTLKITKIGDCLGAVLPKELLEKLNVEEGDNIVITETKDGVMISSYDPEFEAAMQAFDKTRKNYQNALRELAK